ncbi:hypothetical protein RUM43_009079 [Polyplax serrata]|uniref:Uncharacterized protein n=1 Tax=Polyplax serrata TaxID=468196 RepID=A0AAN8PBX3_POLSC
MPLNLNYQNDSNDSSDANVKVRVFDGNTYSGKNLLPYYVTPPRQTGPTEAERKIEELTRQLEEEMEKQEEEGEYFAIENRMKPWKVSQQWVPENHFGQLGALRA